MKFSILIFCLFLLPASGFSQKDDSMLITQIDGNRYIRKNYDKKGNLKQYQSIDAGNLKTSAEIMEVKMTVTSYDKNNNLKGASQTVIRCDPEAGEVLMGIFPFAGGASNKSLKIELPKNNKLYPAGWRDKTTIEDFSFDLKFEGGAAGFFGTESQVSLTDRKVSKVSDNLYRISGSMTLKAYVFGVKISTTRYNYFEEIKSGTGIVRQKFTESNGNYFTIELNSKN